MKRSLLAFWMLLAPMAWGATLDSNDVTPFVDGVMATSMEEHHVAGAVVGIVADDRIVMLKGYGSADIEVNAPVDPQTTMFRIGSVSKLFVWLSLMQLHEEGRIDLETDINEYLEEIRVPDTFEEPITIRHLMTHTPGFEDLVIGLFAKNADAMEPLAEILREQMPERVRPPGTYPSYSNHGVGLAGLILERVTGQPWEVRVEQHILQPLDMDHTTARQPLPDSLAGDMSGGYRWQSGQYKTRDFEFVPLGPAGGVSASGADMVKFLRMFLNLGEVDGTRIMRVETAREMQSVLFRPVPGASGILHGFYESNSHGQRILGHGGDTIWFHSELMLIPDRKIGWFISTNSERGARVRAAFREAFLDRYFGTDQMAGEQDFTKTDLSKIAGFYGSLRHAHNDATKVIKLLSTFSLSPATDGTLVMASGGEVTRFEEVAPRVFKAVDGETRLYFDEDEEGQATHLYISAIPVIAMERMSGLQSPNLHSALLVFSFIVFGWVLIVWTVQHFTSTWARPATVARFRLFGGLLAVFVVLLLVITAAAMSDVNAIVFGLDTSAYVAMAFGWVVVLLSLVLAGLTPSVLKEADIGAISRTGYFLVTLAGLSFSWFLYYWAFL
ncbi:MAG: beta-lactamase family protein [Pseudomonadales bacterium]|nr:beta-lactamase family protein [Pseudomonadales bacterium]